MYLVSHPYLLNIFAANRWRPAPGDFLLHHAAHDQGDFTVLSDIATCIHFPPFVEVVGFGFHATSSERC